MFNLLPQEVQVKIFLFDPTKRENFDRVIHQINFLPVIGQIYWKKRRDGEKFAVHHFLLPVKKIPWFKLQKERPEYMASLRRLGWKQYWGARRMGSLVRKK